jgi:DNA polymerase-1
VTTLLLDSDILAYRAASVGELRVDWDGDGEVSQIPEDFGEIENRVDDAILALVKKLNASHVIVCLSCDRADNWRKDFFPAYKENRAGTLKPLHLAAAKQYMAREYETYERPRLEADDVMGILSTHPNIVRGRRIIVSEDKDMKSIPGWLFNPDKDQAPRMVDTVEADRFHMMQTLMGDPTDGYPGCPGIGPKKAEKILIDRLTYPEMWPAVVRAFEARGLTQDDALIQARISRICRFTDFDYKTKTVIPWSPPQ